MCRDRVAGDRSVEQEPGVRPSSTRAGYHQKTGRGLARTLSKILNALRRYRGCTRDDKPGGRRRLAAGRLDQDVRTSAGPEMNDNAQRFVIVDLRIPFFRLVLFFVKAALAVIPAAIILGVLLMLVTALVAALLGDSGVIIMRRWSF